MKIIVLAIMVSLIESLAQYRLKTCSNPALGVLGYSFVAFTLAYAYRHFKISQFNTIWSCISIVSAYIIGKVFFKEEISVRGYISLCLLIIAIILSNEE